MEIPSRGPAKKAARARYAPLKEERMPDGKIKQIIKDWKLGRITQKTKVSVCGFLGIDGCSLEKNPGDFHRRRLVDLL